MRLIMWNCQMALDKKAQALLDERPDIAVIQECSAKDLRAFQLAGYESHWFGSIRYKGIGVIYRSNWTARLLKEPTHHWIVPLDFDGPEAFRLIAVWSCPKETSFESYVSCIRAAIASHPDRFEGLPVVLAGDFNSNTRWDGLTGGAHMALVRELAEKRMVSLYHSHHNEEHGLGTRHTLHFRRHLDEPFHIDYIFAPQHWSQRVIGCHIGNPNFWIQHSDHCPLVVDLAALD